MIDPRILALGILTTTVLADAAIAADDELSVELTPFGAYRFGGTFNVEGTSESYKLEDSSSFGLILNFPYRDNTQWEILYSRQETDATFSGATINDPVVDVDLQVLQLGGTYQGTGDTVRPYFAATIGGTRVRSRSGGDKSDTFLSGSIGVGLLFKPDSRLGLRIEARAYGTLMDSDTELFCQTGPDLNICAVRVKGDLLSQIETLAGVVFRF